MKLEPHFKVQTLKLVGNRVEMCRIIETESQPERKFSVVGWHGWAVSWIGHGV